MLDQAGWELHEGGRTVGMEQKREEGKQIFKRRGKLGQGVGALKRRVGVEPPYELWVIVQHSGIFLVLNLMKWDKKNPFILYIKNLKVYET